MTDAVRRGDAGTAVAGAPRGAGGIAPGRVGSMGWRRVPRGLAAAMVVALVLRVPYLTERSIWYDEASSWQTASFGVAGIIDSLRLNVHLPVYYWRLQGGMVLFGESAPASVFCAARCGWGTSWTGRATRT